MWKERLRLGGRRRWSGRKDSLGPDSRDSGVLGSVSGGGGGGAVGGEVLGDADQFPAAGEVVSWIASGARC